MKKVLLNTLLFSLIALGSFAQTAADFFNNSSVPVTWLGIDYSHVKLVGNFTQFKDAGAMDAGQIRDKYFPSWNQLIQDEPSRYPIGKALQRSDITLDVNFFKNANKSVNSDDLSGTASPNYTPEDIKKFAAKNNYAGKKGIGVFLIAESYEKVPETALYHFVAVNMQNKQVLFQERISTKAVGFGMRNYWAGSINKLIKAIDKTYYKKWQKEYGK